jgi:serine/threonine protein kinase
MACRENEFLSAFVAGRLLPEAIVALEIHLESCQECFSEVATRLANLSDRDRDSFARRSDPTSRLGQLVGTDSVTLSHSTPSTRSGSEAAVPRAQVAIGPYQVVGLLGSGGMSFVYRARHTDTGALVALKTVKAPSLAFFASLRQEIEFLKQADHPGIVKVFEYDLSTGDPWYAMELLEGQTLAEWNEALWREPGVGGEQRPVAAGQLARVLRLFLSLCEPLTFVHGAGIVHCDLKPLNVFLRRDEQPVLMDFGLVIRARGTIGREALDVSGRVRGTLPYMAPELGRGKTADPRADLYALGCMLYEALTGRPPFVSESPSRLIEMHLATAPTPPSARVTGVPPALDHLVSRLLAKRRDDRLGHAADVGTALVEILADVDPTFRSDGQAPSLRASESSGRTRAPLFRPPLVGRDAQLALLTAQVLDTGRGQGAMILISGESGIGKTFLASEVSQAASLAGMRVVVGECLPRAPTTAPSSEPGAPPLHPFRRLFETIRDRCREGGPDEIDRLLGRDLGVLASCFPTLAQLRPEAVAEPLPGFAARERIVAAVADAIARLAGERRLLLAIDDLQWADDLSLAVLAYLGESYFRDVPLVILGTYRSEEASDTLTQLAERPWLIRARLDRLDRTEVGKMIGGMLSLASPPSELVDFVHQHAEGIPFYAAEYLRALVDTRALVRTRGSWALEASRSAAPAGLSVALPQNLAAIVNHRIERLSATTLAVLETAAVVGRRFDGTDVSLALERPANDIDAALVEAVARQIIEPDSHDQQYRFLHDKLREALYEHVPADERPATHLRVARALLRGEGVDPGIAERYAQIADHLRLGRELGEAVIYLDRAGTHALKRAANGDAERLFREALGLESELATRLPPARRARWERQRADALQGLGRMAESAEALRRGARLLGKPLPEGGGAFAVRMLSQVARQGLHRLWPRRFLGRTTRDGERLQEAGRVYDRMIQAAYYLGKDQDLLFSTVTALNVCEAAPPAQEQATSYGFAAMTAAAFGAHGLAERYFALAFAALARVPDAAAESLLLMHDGAYRMGQGQRDAAIVKLDRASALAEEMAYFRRFDETQATRTGLDVFAGRHLEALDRIPLVERHAGRRGDIQILAWTQLQRMECLLIQSAPIPDDLLGQARALISKLGRPERVWLLGIEAHLAHQDGDRGLALERTREAAKLNAMGPPVHLHCVLSYARLAETSIALMASGPPSQRRELTVLARRACQTLAQSARVHALARPMAALQTGNLFAALARVDKATRTWRSALAEARRMELPIHEARLHQALAQALPAATQGRLRHTVEAQTLLQALRVVPAAGGLGALPAGASPAATAATPPRESRTTV